MILKNILSIEFGFKIDLAILTYKNHYECEVTHRNNYELQNKSKPRKFSDCHNNKGIECGVNKIFQLIELPEHSQSLSEIRIGIKATLN